MSTVEKIVEKANISYGSHIITAATEAKNVSGKRIWNIFFGVVLLALGVYSLFAILFGIGVLLTMPFHIIATPFLFMMLVLMFFVFLFVFKAGFQSFSAKSDWFLILYKDQLLYKYQKDKLYKEVKIPINDFQRCIVLHKFEKGIRIKGKDSSKYSISVHLEYKRNDEEQVISLYRADGYEELNQILMYLTTTKKVPFYYVELNQGLSEKLDDMKGLKEAEKATFLGDLKSYQKVSSIHYTY